MNDDDLALFFLRLGVVLREDAAPRLGVLRSLPPAYRADTLFEKTADLSDSLVTYEAGSSVVREAAVASCAEAVRLWLAVCAPEREGDK